MGRAQSGEPLQHREVPAIRSIPTFTVMFGAIGSRTRVRDSSSLFRWARLRLARGDIRARLVTGLPFLMGPAVSFSVAETPKRDTSWNQTGRHNMEIPDVTLRRVVDALMLAAEAHRHQRRKDFDATPYINHPIALLHILSHEAGVTDPDVLCAALLHDYLEDCCGQKEGPSVQQGREILKQRFGPQVLAYVDAVTDDKSLPRQERKRLQVEHAAHAPEGARLVKLADKVANLRDIHSAPPVSWSFERRQEYFDWAKQVVDQVRGTHARLEALFDVSYAMKPRVST